MELTEFATDGKLREEGTWIEFDDAKFLIRSSDSQAYRRGQMKLAASKVGRFGNNAEKIIEASIELLAKTILLDWKNVKNKGEDFPCTEANKRTLLKHSELRDFIASEAQNLANFRTEAAAEDAETFQKGD